MLYLVPIESYEERYSEQWSRWIPEALSNLNIPFEVIDGDCLTNKIEFGQVLDVYGTHYYKFSQLQILVSWLRSGKIKDGDEIWFADLWFPGIEALFYIRDMMKLDIKITGVLHAGTWDKNDFTYKANMRPWAKGIEKGWLIGFDKVFVGSYYHRNLILEKTHLEDTDKIEVTGLFFDGAEARGKFIDKKENIVVFPHRLDAEKNPALFDRLSVILKNRHPDWSFIKTKDVCSNKSEYYDLLSRAKIAVSFAEQETFGYAMLEAYANGCIPVVPRSLSYSTMQIYSGFCFNDFNHAVDLVDKYIVNKINTGEINVTGLLEEYSPLSVAKKMFNHYCKT